MQKVQWFRSITDHGLTVDAMSDPRQIFSLKGFCKRSFYFESGKSGNTYSR